MSVRQIILLGVGLCCLMGSRSAYGQTANDGAYTLVLRGVAMNQALEELVRLTQIDLVYNSDLVVGKHVYCAGRDLSAEALLRCVLARSGLDYVRSSAGTYILIEGLERPPRYGDLAGSIVDQVTGEPLPYANVLLADASAGTTTDKAGLFSFSSVLSGMHRLVVTYVGYEAAVDSVWVGAGDAKRLEIALRPKELTMVPIVINGLVQRLPSSELGTGTLASHQLEAFHGAGTPDVARGVSGLPGIAVHQPLADLHIQGGASGEHLTLLDGVPVRDPVSLGRHLSAFSPLALDRLTVHKAGFGAEHGSHLSGVIA
ncbi:MAG: carboxypeptidase-like regulatory domain-containing protein, partial [Kiloniellales bacterium]